MKRTDPQALERAIALIGEPYERTVTRKHSAHSAALACGVEPQTLHRALRKRREEEMAAEMVELRRKLSE